MSADPDYHQYGHIALAHVLAAGLHTLEQDGVSPEWERKLRAAQHEMNLRIAQYLTAAEIRRIGDAEPRVSP